MWKLFKKKKTRYPCYNHFDDLKSCYQQKCTQFSITPHLRVLQKLKKARIKSRVSLRDLNLDDRQVAAFLEVLLLQWPGEQWRTLILKGNQISEASCELLATVIAKHRNIEKLDISSNRVSIDGVRMIHDAVMRRNSKLVLNLSNNEALSRTDVKTYVLACRDLKQPHDVNHLETEPRVTEMGDEESTVDDDLTFSPNTDTQHSPSKSVKDELDSSREVNEIQNDESFASTEHTDLHTNMTQSTNITSDMLSPEGQKTVDLSGSSDISQIPVANQSQSSPLVSSKKGGASPQSQSIVSPSRRAASQLVTNRGKAFSPRKQAASNSRATTPRSSRAGTSRGSTPRSATTPRRKSSTPRSLTRRSTTPRSARTNASKDETATSASGKRGGSSNRGSLIGQRQTPSPSVSRPSEAKSSTAEQSTPGKSQSTTPSESAKATPAVTSTKPTIQTTSSPLYPSVQQQQSPRDNTQHSAASASSQKVHYSPRDNALPQQKQPSEPSLAYSPNTPVNRVPSTPVIVSETSSVPSSPEGLISPLRDPNHREDSPTELHAVSREISELSGIDQRNMEDVSFNFDDDVVDSDEDDEEINHVDNILNSALKNHEQQMTLERRREERKREKLTEAQGSRRWIQPNIYKYKKLKEQKRRIELQKKEAEKSSLPLPPKKKVLKRVKVDSAARIKYLQRMFVLQYEHKQLDDGHFQYETPVSLQMWNCSQKDGNSSITDDGVDMQEDERAVYRALPSPVMLPGDDDEDNVLHEEDSGEQQNQSSYVDSGSHAILPHLDPLPEPLFAISLRAANIAPTVPFENIFPEHSFHTLECIDLSFNGLTTLTDNFQHFPNLRVLALRGNRLSSLAGLENNIGLEQLDAAGNKLESAEFLEYMQNLQVLDISYNRVETASGFRMLTMNKMLTILNVEGNPAQVRNGTELRITLCTLLKDSLKIYNNEPSPMLTFKKRVEKREAKLEAIRKKQQPFTPSSPNAKVDLSRRISIQERYAQDAEAKRRVRQLKEQEEQQKRKEKRKKQRESRKQFYTKVKWQQLNTIPRLETPRYRSTDELNHQLNASLRHSSSVLESILEHATPRSVNIPRSLRSPRLTTQSGVVAGNGSQTRSQRLFQSISHDVTELQHNPPRDDEYNTDAAQLMEVKEDLSATFMAFATLSEYMERDAHHSEILELRKLLEDCSLFEPMYLGTKVQSSAIQEYVKRANRTKEKLRILFDSYDRDKQEENGVDSMLSESGVTSSLLSPRDREHSLSIHGGTLDQSSNLSNSMGSAQKQFLDVATKLEQAEQDNEINSDAHKKINVKMPHINVQSEEDR